MAIENAGRIKELAQGFSATMKSLRHAFRKAGLSTVQQFELSHTAPDHNCALLLVDSPLLLFEAVALDRSAAAFLPLHVVVTGDQYSSRIRWCHPAEVLGLHVSPVAKGPVEALYARLTRAIEGAGQKQEEVENDDVYESPK